MNVAEYFDWIRDTPPPSVQECMDFYSTISSVHSWYKRLSLRYGADFVVYLDADVGGLAYLWRHGGRQDVNSNDARYSRSRYHFDQLQLPRKPAPDLPPEIIQRCGFVLYPYVNPEQFLEITDISPKEYSYGGGPRNVHGETLRAIWAGAAHPGKHVLRLLNEKDFGSGGFDFETEEKPIWEAIATREIENERAGKSSALPLWVSGMGVRPRQVPLQHHHPLRWAMGLDWLSDRQRACARHLWYRFRKLSCLARTEYLKLDIALSNLRELVHRPVCENGGCVGELRPAPPSSPYRDYAGSVCSGCGRQGPLPTPVPIWWRV